MSDYRRSNRMRFKPLQYWNNEKLQYDLHGDLQYISAITAGSTLMPGQFLHETALETSQTNLTVVPLKMSSHKHEVSILKVMSSHTSLSPKQKAVIANSRTRMKEVDENTLIQCKHKLYLHGKSAQLGISETTISESQTQFQNKSHNQQRIGNKCKRQKKYKHFSKKKLCLSSVNKDNETDPEKDNSGKPTKIHRKRKLKYAQHLTDEKSHSTDDDYISDKDKCQKKRHLNSSEKNPLNDINVPWKLSDMHKIRNEQNETYFIRVPEISTSSLAYGFLFLESKTLHWQNSSISKEIFVIDGSGKLSLEAVGKKKEVNLSKGLRLKVANGDILLEKNKDCGLLKLFIIYK